MSTIKELSKDFKLELDLAPLDISNIKITDMRFGFKDFGDENLIKKGDEVTITDEKNNLILKCKVLKVNKEDYNVFAKLKVLEKSQIN